MFDNHTFERIAERDSEGLVNRVIKLFGEDKYGSVFVRDEHDATLQQLTLHGQRNGVPTKEIEEWAKSIVDEITFRKAMSA